MIWFIVLIFLKVISLKPFVFCSYVLRNNLTCSWRELLLTLIFFSKWWYWGFSKFYYYYYYSWGVRSYIPWWDIRLHQKKWLSQCSGHSFLSNWTKYKSSLGILIFFYFNFLKSPLSKCSEFVLIFYQFQPFCSLKFLLTNL